MDRSAEFLENLGPKVLKLRRCSEISWSDAELETTLRNLEDPLEAMSHVQLGWRHGGDVQSKHGLGQGAISALLEVLLLLSQIQTAKRNARASKLMHLACIILGNLCEVPELLQLLVRCLFLKESRDFSEFQDASSNDRHSEPKVVEIILDQIPGYKEAEQEIGMAEPFAENFATTSLDPLDWAGKEPFLRFLASLVAAEPGFLSVQQYIALQTPLLAVLMSIEVDSSSSGLLALDLFAACCESSVHFRQSVKTLPSAKRKACYRCLLSFLDARYQPEVMVRSLLALLALLSGDSLETKIFDPVNIEQAATLVFRQVLGFGSLTIQRLCIKVLRKLLLLPSAGPHLYTSGYLGDFIDRALTSLADRTRPGGSSNSMSPPECIYAGLQATLELAVNARRSLHDKLREGDLCDLYWDGIVAGLDHPHAPTATSACSFLAALLRSSSSPGLVESSMMVGEEDNGNWLWAKLISEAGIRDSKCSVIQESKVSGDFSMMNISPGRHMEMMDDERSPSPIRQSGTEATVSRVVQLAMSRVISVSKVIGLFGKVGRQASQIEIQTNAGRLEGEAVQKEPECVALLDLLCTLVTGHTAILQQLQTHLNLDHLANIIQAQVCGLEGLAALHYPCPPMEVILRGMILLVNLSGNRAGLFHEDQDIQEDSTWARRALASLLAQSVVTESIGSALWQSEDRQLTGLAITALTLLQARGGAESMASTDAVSNFSQKYLSKYFEMSKKLEFLEDKASKMEVLVAQKTNDASETHTLAVKMAEQHELMVTKLKSQHTEEVVSLRQKLDSKCEGLNDQIQELTQHLEEAQASSERYRQIAKDLQKERKQHALQKASGDEEAGRLKRLLTETQAQLDEKEFHLQSLNRKRQDVLKRCDTAENEKADMHSDIFKLRRKLDNQLNEMDEVKAERNVLQKSKKDLEDKIEDTYSKLISLAKSYKSKEQENEDLFRNISRLEQQLQANVEESDSKRQLAGFEKERLQERLKEIESAHRKLKKAAEKLQQKCDSRDSDMDQLRRKISSQETQIRLIQSESTSKDNELDDLKEKVRQLQLKHKNKAKECEHMQKELDRQQGIIGYINKLSKHDEEHLPSTHL